MILCIYTLKFVLIILACLHTVKLYKMHSNALCLNYWTICNTVCPI